MRLSALSTAGLLVLALSLEACSSRGIFDLRPTRYTGIYAPPAQQLRLDLQLQDLGEIPSTRTQSTYFDSLHPSLVDIGRCQPSSGWNIEYRYQTAWRDIYCGGLDKFAPLAYQPHFIYPRPGFYMNYAQYLMRLREFKQAIPYFNLEIKFYPESYIFITNYLKAYGIRPHELLFTPQQVADVIRKNYRSSTYESITKQLDTYQQEFKNYARTPAIPAPNATPNSTPNTAPTPIPNATPNQVVPSRPAPQIPQYQQPSSQPAQPSNSSPSQPQIPLLDEVKET